MTEKQLRRLGKTDLLTIIRDQEAELEQAKIQLAGMQEKLEAKRLSVEQCGSLAEACLQLNGIFESAQAAADQYVASIKEREAGSEQKLAQIENAAVLRAKSIIRNAEERCSSMEKESRTKVNAYWLRLSEMLEQFYKSHVGLKQILDSNGIVVTLPEVQEGQKRNV